MQRLFLLSFIALEFVSSADRKANFNPQPDPPFAPTPPDDSGLVGPKTCCNYYCPPPAHCEMIIPPCGTIPQPTCVCPKGQVWSDCPGCVINCADLFIKRPCLNVCRPPQCICPDGELFDQNGKCIPQEKCPPPGK